MRHNDLCEPVPADRRATVSNVVNAIGERIDNAAALTGFPSPLNIPAPTDTADQDAAMEQILSAPETTRKPVSDVGDSVSEVLSTVTSQLPEPPVVTPRRSQRKPAQRASRTGG